VIEKFPFGPITIDGHVNTSNMLITFGDKVPISWWRSFDYLSILQPIESLVDFRLEHLIESFDLHIHMKSTPELKLTFADQGMALVAAWNKFTVKHRDSTVIVIRKRMLS
jgi:hypothetical protein